MHGLEVVEALFSFSLSLSPSFSQSFFRLSAYLPIYLSIYLPVYLSALSMFLSICPSVHLSICPSVHPSIHPSTHPPIHPSTHPPIHPPTHPSIHPSISPCLSVNLSIYLMQCSLSVYPSIHLSMPPPVHLSVYSKVEVGSSKTKQVCEIHKMQAHSSETTKFCGTFSIFEVDSIKNEAILRDFLQKWKVACRADGLVPMHFAIFPVHLSKLLRLPRKSDARSYEVLHLSRKIMSANLKIWCSKMHPVSWNQRPGPNISDEDVSCIAPATRNALSQILCKCPMRAIAFESAAGRTRLTHFCQGAKSIGPATQNRIRTWKIARERQFLTLLTSKCASRHNGVHFVSTFQLPKVVRDR